MKGKEAGNRAGRKEEEGGAIKEEENRSGKEREEGRRQEGENN